MPCFKNLILLSNTVYISKKYLVELGIKENTIEAWIKRNGNVKRVSIEKNQYFNISTLPFNTKCKLPTDAELLALLNQEQKDTQVDSCYNKLQYAQLNKFADYRAYYRDAYNLNSDDALKAAMKRAVWERVMQLYNDAQSVGYKGGLRKGALDILYRAYNLVYEGQYSSKHAFLRTINTCKGAGFDTIIIDKRKIKNGKTAKFNELHSFFVRGVAGIGKGYNATEILRKITPMCNAAKVEIPSLSWVKQYIRNNIKHSEYSTRYGKDKSEKNMPYASMQPALHADKQWQLDGWNLPFYFKNENNRLDKLTLITVRDAYSKKIIGYSIDRTENRLTILEAFQDAVSNTGCLPFEIVVDNHSFNKTKEAENFINQIQQIGVTWTVTENPQYKAITERYFKTLGEQFCKDHYGYIGQGVKSRDKNAHSSPELIQSFIKAGRVLSEDEIKLIGIDVVKQFNTSYQVPQLNQTPNQLYNESEKPSRFELDLHERLRIFINRTEYKISRGQINIIVAGKKYEYQVNASIFNKYNGKIVGVRYDNLELIYLFDLKTDAAIGTVKQKSKIHGALADQSDEDLKMLAKNKGRVNGIKTQSRKSSEDLREKALSINPDALEILHYYTTPKDVLKAAEIDLEIKWEAEKRGIDLSRVLPVTKATEITNPVYLNKKRAKIEDSPFTPVNHKISILEPDEYINEQ